MTPEVDAQGFWLTVSDLAKRKGISKQAIAKRVGRLEAQGLLASRPGHRGTKLVNVAEFDRAAGEATDAVRELNGSPAAATAVAQELNAPPISSGLAKEQTRRAGYDADLKQLELEERLGKLIPIEDAQRAMIICAEGLVRVIDQLPARAEENAAAVAKDGETGARTFLRGFARDLREQLARSMTLLAAGDKDPETDEV